MTTAKNETQATEAKIASYFAAIEGAHGARTVRTYPALMIKATREKLKFWAKASSDSQPALQTRQGTRT